MRRPCPVFNAEDIRLIAAERHQVMAERGSAPSLDTVLHRITQGASVKEALSA